MDYTVEVLVCPLFSLFHLATCFGISLLSDIPILDVPDPTTEHMYVIIIFPCLLV